MLGKVALRNIRRSVKDYAIYFVTLLMAVTLFYAFNSISEQQVMTEINESSHMDVSQFVGEMVSLFSYIIAFVLAFLIIYANSLLIRRRKREFGMYFMLGMRPIQVSRIIIYETVLVGVISLALGLGLGVLVSQLLSFATAAIFGISAARLPIQLFDGCLHHDARMLLRDLLRSSGVQCVLDPPLQADRPDGTPIRKAKRSQSAIRGSVWCSSSSRSGCWQQPIGSSRSMA